MKQHGVESAEVLKSHITDDILNYGIKIQEVYKKLDQQRSELLNVTVKTKK